MAHVDLLVVDMFLPGKDGYEVIDACRRLRPSVPILGISGGEAGVADAHDLLRGARELGAMAICTPVVVGFAAGAEALGGLLAGVTVSGVLLALFMSNAGGAWDNAKKSFEGGGFKMKDGSLHEKGSDAHNAAVVGDTVGDPFKDTAGPSLNILVKLMSVVALVIAPLIAVQ
jgi:Na+/H+-translocating membrane pyrophosphatase